MEGRERSIDESECVCVCVCVRERDALREWKCLQNEVYLALSYCSL